MHRQLDTLLKRILDVIPEADLLPELPVLLSLPIPGETGFDVVAEYLLA